MNGRVEIGINNIYTVRVGDDRYECRIKGKVLRRDERAYNPIAVGDLVEIEVDRNHTGHGWITSREDRTTAVERWNKKRKAPQVIAANADLMVCVTSVVQPPFRPRFLDRLILGGEATGLEVVIAANKVDLGVPETARERLEDYRRIGYDVVEVSADTGAGVDQLRRVIGARLAVFVGQSGVGKSSLLNALEPALELKTGAISHKHDRGAHTTNFARMLDRAEGTPVIDTPGIRELEIVGIEVNELRLCFPEFVEPDCAVLAALELGEIHPDRYESYIRILDELEAAAEDYGRNLSVK